MKILNVQIETQKVTDDSIVSEWTTKKITIAMSPLEITMRQWTDFWLTKQGLPDSFNALDSMTGEERNAAFAAFTGLDWQNFTASCLKLVACMVTEKADKMLLSNLPIVSKGDNGVLSLYFQILNTVASYEPQIRESFLFKGEKFIFPKKMTDNVGREWFGSELTAGEAFEALQCAHILNASDENGVYVLEDRKYHTDIAMLATLARYVDDNEIVEKVPVETLEARAFFEKRVAFFQDAPMNIALDMAFFLRNFKILYANTLISQSLTRVLQQALTT